MRYARPRLDSTVILTSLIPTLVAVGILIWVGSLINWSYIETLDFTVLYRFRHALLAGLGNTLLLTFLAIVLGLAIGTTLAVLLKVVTFRPIQWLILAYIEILRNTPLVFQVFWVHFALPQITGVSTTVFQTGCITFVLQGSAYLADLVRGGIEAVPKQQWEAAESLGLTAKCKWLEIILPQAVKIIIPPLANLTLGYFKTSAALALLQVGELMTVASRIATFTFRPIETFTIVGLIYFLGSSILSWGTYQIERVFKHPRN